MYVIKITNNGTADNIGETSIPANSIAYIQAVGIMVVTNNTTGVITSVRLLDRVGGATGTEELTTSETIRLQYGTLTDGGYFRSILSS